MKQPLWILNSALVLLLFIALIFIFFSRPSIPERESLDPRAPTREKIEDIVMESHVIYERDLFNTYYVESMLQAQKEEALDEMPPSPGPVPVRIPPVTLPHFLDPLPIKLTGVMVTDNVDESMAIIAHTQTQEEKGYKIGDKFEDAQLIRIFANKAIIIRSNGQQEILYLRQEDAQEDTPSIVHGYWDSAIKQLELHFYLIDPMEFIRRVKNLGTVIESLDLTMAYHDGVTIGTRIGSLDDHSFGRVIGLVEGDVIESINGIKATNITNNEKIYNMITAIKKGGIIHIVIHRAGQKRELRLKIDDITVSGEEGEISSGMHQKTDQEREAEKIEIMHQKYKFAPTAQELKKRDQQATWHHGQRNARQKLKTRNVISNSV